MFPGEFTIIFYSARPVTLGPLTTVAWKVLTLHFWHFSYFDALEPGIKMNYFPFIFWYTKNVHNFEDANTFYCNEIKK